MSADNPMQAAINLLNTLLPMLYAVVAVNYSIEFFRDDPFAKRIARPLLLGTLGLHTAYLALRTVLHEHVPLASIFELMTCVAYAVAVVYLYVETRSKTHKTGMFLLSFSFVFQTLSSAFIPQGDDFPEILRNPLFGIHTGSAVIGYAAFAVSAIYGILFLLLYHDLKANRFGIVYERLPSLELLSKMSLRAALCGVVFLTFTILCGTLWAWQRFPGFYTDPKFVLTLVVWAVYASGVSLHYGLGWGGRRTIYLSLIGFALILFSVAAGRLWLNSFHGFA